MTSQVQVFKTQAGSLAEAIPDMLKALNTEGGSSPRELTITRTRKISRVSVLRTQSENGSPSPSSSLPCPVHIRLIGMNGGPCTCDLADILRGSTGHTASSDYLSQVNVRSQTRTAVNPLLVISLDGVIEAQVETHLRGGSPT
ncbi:hypothetical protein JCM11491_005431 [Sporobolomyces phaffii]